MTTITAETVHYPCVVVIDGVAIRLEEQVAADWIPDVLSRSLTFRGRISPDPSNGGLVLPKRSKAGYPLTYLQGRIGLVLPGFITFGDRTFADDGEVAEHLMDRLRAGRGQAAIEPAVEPA